MVRRNRSAAPASARRCDLPLSLLPNWWHNPPHSNKHVDVFKLMPRRSRLIWQLTSVFQASLMLLVNDDVSSRVADMAQRIGNWLVSLDMVPW